MLHLITYPRGYLQTGIDTFLEQLGHEYVYLDDLTPERWNRYDAVVIHGGPPHRLNKTLDHQSVMKDLLSITVPTYVVIHERSTLQTNELYGYLELINKASGVFVHSKDSDITEALHSFDPKLPVFNMFLPFQFTEPSKLPLYKTDNAAFVGRSSSWKRYDMAIRLYSEYPAQCSLFINVDKSIAENAFDDKMFAVLPSEIYPPNIGNSLEYVHYEALNRDALPVLHKNFRKSPIGKLIGDLPIYLDEYAYGITRDELMRLNRDRTSWLRRVVRLKNVLAKHNSPKRARKFFEDSVRTTKRMITRYDSLKAYGPYNRIFDAFKG
jgi:hypothetical protein